MKRFFIFAILGLSFLSFLGCNNGNSGNGGNGGTKATIITIDENGNTVIESAELQDLIDSIPADTNLTDDEVASLKLLREEEKLAHDVYTKLYEIHGTSIFTNISDSEQNHTDYILVLLEYFGIEDPNSETFGVFENETLQTYYDDLVAQGETSLVDALIVGATVEELDIHDITTEEEKITVEQILTVYESLKKGSRNHLRSFSSQLESNGYTNFTPQFITQDEYDEIINSYMETGND